MELHGSSNASTKAYAVAIYVHVVDEVNNVQTSLLCVKSWVVPVKTQTVSHLELLGAVLLARLMNSVIKALSNSVSADDIYYWTDLLD